MTFNIQGKAVHFLKYRVVKTIAESFGFAVYDAHLDYKKPLDDHTQFTIDERTVRDQRSSTIGGDGIDLTITTDGLEDVLDVSLFKKKRVMETGPKYGIHSRWIDRNIEPSELVFCDFASEKWRHDTWEKEITCKHHFVYGDLRCSKDLLAQQPFDLVFFLGVMYHSAYHIQLLSFLNRITILGGNMLLETTFDSRPDAVLRVNWHAKTGKAKMVPSLDALRVMLAWTGWRKVTFFKNYRPGTSEVLLMCEKTDEIVGSETDFCGVVTTTRLGPDGKPLAVEKD